MSGLISRGNSVVANNSWMDTGRFMCFSLGAQKFAVPLLQVKEVIGQTEITPIPQSPSHFKGVMNLRGQVISVFDLREKLKILKASAASSTSTTIVIADFGHISLGLIVDSVDSVVHYSPSEIGEGPAVEKSVEAQYVLGVAKTDQNLVLILDLAKVLNTQDYKLTQQATSPAA